ncbi:unnamed protein product [Strongylus vulgaris]|uniref:Uncharacterized protein n=1 Tax=Strongylus vulgaris TaxID=40348 RepID=A0A3P7J635_STRVU|nr:unnamed protein product [Strongylus vulgaris]
MSVPSLSSPTSASQTLFPARRLRQWPCSFEKGVKIRVGGVCPGVAGAEHETISMEWLTCPFGPNPISLQHDTGLDDIRRQV